MHILHLGSRKKDAFFNYKRFASGLEIREPLGFVVRDKSVEYGVDVTGYNSIEVEVSAFLPFAFEAMVGAAILREVVCSDTLAAVSRTDHGFPGCCFCGALFALVMFVKPGS